MRFSLAFFVIGLVVVVLILARLVAAAAPSLGGEGGFAPSGAGQTNNYYSQPSGP